MKERRQDHRGRVEEAAVGKGKVHLGEWGGEVRVESLKGTGPSWSLHKQGLLG